MILTARIAEHDLIPSDLLRQKHFSPRPEFPGGSSDDVSPAAGRI